ncbi:hypothetical protein BD289DRAFT_202988 [Coniella lustricola]|uniref:Uncharacterized protein n=1 Tax=Coniella lustricola TaxID=2025994 RepID=A0A2T2ZSF7_9PEZI|nr:hypothetical protein BD289DRAFT_202988 [Coniella lustricola]
MIQTRWIGRKNCSRNNIQPCQYTQRSKVDQGNIAPAYQYPRLHRADIVRSTSSPPPQKKGGLSFKCREDPSWFPPLAIQIYKLLPSGVRETAQNATLLACQHPKERGRDTQRERCQRCSSATVQGYLGKIVNPGCTQSGGSLAPEQQRPDRGLPDATGSLGRVRLFEYEQVAWDGRCGGAHVR